MRNNRLKKTGILLMGALLVMGSTCLYAYAQAEETEAVMETEADAEEIIWEEAAIMYAMDDVYVRENVDGGEALAILHRGQAVWVLGECGEKYIVDYNTEVTEAEPETEDLEIEETETAVEEDPVKTGYVGKSYLTEDKQAAEDAVAAQDYALAQAQAAAAAAAAQAAAAAAQPAPSQGAARQEISREFFNGGCITNGADYWIVTYSDGSQERIMAN